MFGSVNGPRPSGSDANKLVVLFVSCTKNCLLQCVTHFVIVVNNEAVLIFENSANSLQNEES